MHNIFFILKLPGAISMANRIKSAIKRNRQNVKRRARNQSVRSALRTLVKKYRQFIADKDTDKVSETIKALNKALDKAATKGVIRKKTASRYVSRLSKQAHNLSQQSS